MVTVYKTLRRLEDGRLASCMMGLYGSSESFQLIYTPGEVTRPFLGELFCWPSIDRGREWTENERNEELWEAEAPSIRRLHYIACPSDGARFGSFWEMYLADPERYYYFYSIAPYLTHSCPEMKLIRRVH
jgi:hypothetical protein